MITRKRGRKGGREEGKTEEKEGKKIKVWRDTVKAEDLRKKRKSYQPLCLPCP